MARPTGNDYIDSILYGTTRWGPSSLTYHFDNSYSTWSLFEKQAFRAALKSWSDVANLNFRETISTSSADLIEYLVDDEEMTDIIGAGSLGAHFMPVGSNYSGQLEGYFNWESYTWPAGTAGFDRRSLDEGGLARSVYVHELGHALGLAHPHDRDGLSERMPGVYWDDDLGQHDLNQGVYTVMSYNDGWVGQSPWDNGIFAAGYNSGPGALDIAAIQFLYGADTSNKPGDTVYRLDDAMGWNAIWDTGGTDRLQYDGNRDVLLDLRAAQLNEGPNAGGFLSYVKGSDAYGGYTIAGDFTNALANRGGERGVIIENATAGGGDDRLIGNEVRNVLKGNGGDDKLGGRGGNDKLFGGSGSDKAYGGDGYDIVSGGNGADELAGGDLNDKLYGEGGNDLVMGGNGKDVVNGGTGNDILRGGGGSDRFIFRDGFDRDVIKEFANNTDVLALDDNLWGGGMTIAAMVASYAHDLGSDTLFDFGGGDQLRVEGIGNPNALINDILIL